MEELFGKCQTRYDTYLEKTKPLIEFYKEKGILHYVNSESIDTMLKSVEEILHEEILND